MPVAREWLLALPLLTACGTIIPAVGDASAGGPADAGSAGAAALAATSGRGGGEPIGGGPAPRPSSDAGEPACRGPGRYEAGKEGSYRPCCPDLREVFGGRYDEAARACLQPPLRIYACVRGTCGDGACELGEADRCFCPSDCSSSEPSEADDAGLPNADPSWITVTTKCGFTLRAPPDIVENEEQGIDSCIIAYDADGCSYHGDYGGFSGPLDVTAGDPGYRSAPARIDGLDATVVTYGPAEPPRRWFAGVHFPSLPAGHGVKLTFTARCETAAAQGVALQVFETMRFER